MLTLKTMDNLVAFIKAMLRTSVRSQPFEESTLIAACDKLQADVLELGVEAVAIKIVTRGPYSLNGANLLLVCEEVEPGAYNVEIKGDDVMSYQTTVRRLINLLVDHGLYSNQSTKLKGTLVNNSPIVGRRTITHS